MAARKLVPSAAFFDGSGRLIDLLVESF